MFRRLALAGLLLLSALPASAQDSEPDTRAMLANTELCVATLHGEAARRKTAGDTAGQQRYTDLALRMSDVLTEVAATIGISKEQEALNIAATEVRYTDMVASGQLTPAKVVQLVQACGDYAANPN